MVNHQDFGFGIVGHYLGVFKRLQKRMRMQRLDEIVLHRKSLCHPSFGHHGNDDDGRMLIQAGAANRMKNVPAPRVGQDQSSSTAA